MIEKKRNDENTFIDRVENSSDIGLIHEGQRVGVKAHANTEDQTFD